MQNTFMMYKIGCHFVNKMTGFRSFLELRRVCNTTYANLIDKCMCLSTILKNYTQYARSLKDTATCLRGICKSVAAHLLVLLLRILLDYLIRFSCISKHCISIDKRRKLPHSRDRCVKDKNRKK